MAIQKIEEMIASNSEANSARPGGMVPVSGSNPPPTPIPPAGGGQIIRGNSNNVPPALMSLTMQVPQSGLEPHNCGKLVSTFLI